MGTFNMNEADNYGAQSGSFFTLKDDKDVAQVRFLYNSVDDVQGYAVHRVQVGDKERYVNCLRAYNEPLEKCPFCAAQLKVVPRLFIKLFNITANECQLWERSKSYFQRLASLSSRYNPLHDEIVEIERNGKPRDTSTTYEIYEVSCDDTRLEDLPEAPQVLGTIVLDKSADEMRDFLDTGEFPNNGGGNREQRRGDDDRPSGRRTPSNRRGDRF